MSILVLTSDTLIGTPATGNLEYNGQFYGTDSNASRAQMQRLAQSTVVPSTSGTSIEFTAIPAWAKKITVMFNGVSTNSTNIKQIQLGTGSTTYTIAGYLSGTSILAGTVASQNVTTGIGIYSISASDNLSGAITLWNITGTTWVASGTLAVTGATNISVVSSGSIALGAALTAVRVIGSSTGNPADTFDNGQINILYEG